jgi:hypothetical protein
MVKQILVVGLNRLPLKLADIQMMIKAFGSSIKSVQ